MNTHVSCPTCDYFQVVAATCCECGAHLSLAVHSEWTERGLSRLLAAIEAM